MQVLMRKKVLPMNEVVKYIHDTFDIDEFIIDDFKYLPQGKILTDKYGRKILIYYDFLKDSVNLEFD